jgi:hypothetical protein
VCFVKAYVCGAALMTMLFVFSSHWEAGVVSGLFFFFKSGGVSFPVEQFDFPALSPKITKTFHE